MAGVDFLQYCAMISFFSEGLMQGDKQPKQRLDDDILQCKADLKKALQAILRDNPENQSDSTENPTIQPSESLQTANTVQAESLELPLTDDVQASPIGIRILPFETLQKKKSETSTSVVYRSPEPETISQTQTSTMIEQLNTEIDQLKLRLEEQKQLNDQLNIKSGQCDAISEKNKQLLSEIESSTQVTEAQRIRIEELEQELAGKINELLILKQKAEENAAALASMSQQLQLTDNEKEAAEKRFEAQAAELAKTLEILKTTQESAAETLRQRQRQVEDIQRALSEAETQLEQANADNVQLTREKTELSEALHAARLHADYQEKYTSEQFILDDTEQEPLDDLSPEPYCEPTGEVISEDDVHLEQKLSDNQIPTLNLAEQIMAEQRKAAAARRQRPGSTNKTVRNGSIEHVIQHYVGRSETNTPLSEMPSVLSQGSEHRSDRFLRWQGEILSDYQKSLLDSIVGKDILRFCGTKSLSTASEHTFGKRPMDN